MKPRPEPREHGIDATNVARLLTAKVSLLVATIALASCSGLPRPKPAPIRENDYVAVPFPPRPPPVEVVPPRPTNDRTKPLADPFDEDRLVWADGGWEWQNDHYEWQTGAWVVLPDGAKRSRWALVRRPGDGQLFFAPSRWRVEEGLEPHGWKDIEAPRPIARSVTRQADD